MSEQLSSCHKAPTRLGGEGTTRYLICNKCDKPCDLWFEQPVSKPPVSKLGDILTWLVVSTTKAIPHRFVPEPSQSREDIAEAEAAIIQYFLELPEMQDDKRQSFKSSVTQMTLEELEVHFKSQLRATIRKRLEDVL